MTDLENAIDNALGLDEYANPFGDEFVAPPEGSESVPTEIVFNRWGQYANLPPIPGDKRSRNWTRASTLKDILGDKRNLDLWSQRQVLRGIAMSPRLIAPVQDEIAAGEIDFDEKKIKDWLNSICDKARGVAGSYEGSDTGTAFHSAAEKYDAGNPFTITEIMNDLDDQQATMLAAYAKSLKEHEIKPIGHLMERVICVPELKIAGRLDRVYQDSDGILKIGDLKSQKWEPGAFDAIALCVQLAIYANASWMLDEQAWEWVPFPEDISRETGMIMWVPAKQPGVAEVYDIDLEWGWELAQVSFRIRNDWRKDKTRVSRRTRPAVSLHDLG